MTNQEHRRSTSAGEVRHEYAEVNGVRLHYATAGNGELILFVHGFPEFWYAWKDQLAELGRDHRAVALDMRGYNLSSKPASVEEYDRKHLVEDLRALAETLGYRKLTLVGHDWGGVIAWAFAIDHPELLEKLIIINAPHPALFARELRDNPRQQKASRYMLAFRGAGAEAALSANHHAALVQAVMGEGLKTGVFDQRDKAAYIEAWSQPGALTGALSYYRAARVGPPPVEGDRSSGTFLGDTADFTVRVPTLVIWGERDSYLLSGNLDGLDELVPDLTVERIPDATHWVVHEKPELVNALIRGFIEAKK
ncbi:MAG TPA: alpha/beta hydrolase [Thermoanaerobaculia bacterium]|nr:alpha/beta hydrolase [Thermoanaerobaculia bacterium]